MIGAAIGAVLGLVFAVVRIIQVLTTKGSHYFGSGTEYAFGAYVGMLAAVAAAVVVLAIVGALIGLLVAALRRSKEPGEAP